MALLKIDELAQNFATINADRQRSADGMRYADRELKSRNARIDRHLQRLEEGEEELTPAPYDLDELHRAAKKDPP